MLAPADRRRVPWCGRPNLNFLSFSPPLSLISCVILKLTGMVAGNVVMWFQLRGSVVSAVFVIERLRFLPELSSVSNENNT